MVQDTAPNGHADQERISLAARMRADADEAEAEERADWAVTQAEEPVEWRIARAFANGWAEGFQRGMAANHGHRLDHS